MNIAVVGIGYVGLSLAVLLAQENEVTAVDLIQSKIDALNKRISPINDPDVEKYLSTKQLNLKAVTNGSEAYANADFVIVAVQTNYDPVSNFFDTGAVEKVITDVFAINPKALVIVKSTVPVGYTEKLRERFKTDNIIFSPEFLREGKALHDNLYP
ncbi:MAG: NAD(P)-binding domain-containing protein, partial [Oscillospiraceae bacterium]|nr:NAD(P)-binding domain-containing protein [Oscillospiraceae bacterium]